VLLVFEGNDRVGRGHCMLANDHQVCCRCLLLPHRGWMKIENRFERLIVRDDRPFFVRTCIRPYTASHEDASSLSQLITRLSRIYFIRSIVAYQPFLCCSCTANVCERLASIAQRDHSNLHCSQQNLKISFLVFCGILSNYSFG
jgi:hypothetical protein